VPRLFFRWLVRENLLGANPASELEPPRVGQPLPRNVLTREEVETILNVPDLETDAGVRDRAILEVLYSTGLRRSELCGLDRFDLDIGRAVVTVRAGKGNKDRIVPIGERALDWVNRYLVDVRPGWLVNSNEPSLFVSQYGSACPPTP
jgi:integrase/recombinase XerD